eukprot:3965336-Alexandrium_andersonii.AAC.1
MCIRDRRRTTRSCGKCQQQPVESGARGLANTAHVAHHARSASEAACAAASLEGGGRRRGKVPANVG